MRRTRSCPSRVHLAHAAALIAPPWTPRTAARIAVGQHRTPLSLLHLDTSAEGTAAARGRVTSDTSSASSSSVSTGGSPPPPILPQRSCARSSVSSNASGYSTDPPARPTCSRPSLRGFFKHYVPVRGAQRRVTAGTSLISDASGYSTDPPSQPTSPRPMVCGGESKSYVRLRTLTRDSNYSAKFSESSIPRIPPRSRPSLLDFFQSHLLKKVDPDMHTLHEVDDPVSDDENYSESDDEILHGGESKRSAARRCDVVIPPLCVAVPCDGPESDQDSRLPLAHVVAVRPALPAPRAPAGTHTTVAHEMKSMMRQGMELFWRSKYNLAKSLFEAVRYEAHEMRNTDLEGEALCNLASVYESTKQHAEASDLYQQSLRVFKQQGGSSFAAKKEARILYNLSHSYVGMQRYEEALGCLDQARNLIENVILAVPNSACYTGGDFERIRSAIDQQSALVLHCQAKERNLKHLKRATASDR